MPLYQRCEQKSDTSGHCFEFRHLKDTTCELCRVIYEGIVAILSPVTPDDNSSATFPPFSSDKRDNFEVDVFDQGILVSFWCSWGRVPRSPGKVIRRRHRLSIIGTTCPWGILPTRRDITTLDYGGEGSFNTALDWIQNCVTRHGCSDNALTVLPTRVVSTGVDDSPIRIVSGNLKHDRYICLSHCWGQERPLVTTTKNLSSFAEQIPWSAIPATFQDAILFARRLGIQYIWIDSLCIIQDSLADWAIESSRMADIYRNSYVTIAATSSKGSTGGLYLKHARQPGVTLRGETSLDKPYSIRCQYAMAPHNPVEEETPKNAIQHPISIVQALEDSGEVVPVFPLLTRGWVFQERLLSPRFLQFGRDELLWDCRESMLCECGQRYPDLPYNQVNPGTNDDLLAHKWRKTVEFYSTLNLTFPTDKLPALSGLAKRMSEHRPREIYLAGLWSNSLNLDLLWMPHGPERAQEEYLGPSWSWSCSGRRFIYPST